MDISFRNAFTLLQLIIVVVVLGILAGISIPQYTKLKERTFAKEAIANLKLIAATERVYYDENSTYRECNCITSEGCEAAAIGCNNIFKLDLKTANWAYIALLKEGGTGFTILANRQGGSYITGCTYTFESDSEDNEPTKGPYCP